MGGKVSKPGRGGADAADAAQPAARRVDDADAAPPSKSKWKDNAGTALGIGGVAGILGLGLFGDNLLAKWADTLFPFLPKEMRPVALLCVYLCSSCCCCCGVVAIAMMMSNN